MGGNHLNFVDILLTEKLLLKKNRWLVNIEKLVFVRKTNSADRKVFRFSHILLPLAECHLHPPPLRNLTQPPLSCQTNGKKVNYVHDKALLSIIKRCCSDRN